MTQTIRDADESDFARILQLNDAEVESTSAMDLDRLRELRGLSSVCRVLLVDAHVAAFVIAMREAADYANDNYAWFAARFTRFVYVDRIVVGADYAGLGIGSRLYEDVFAYARSARVQAVTCEYNLKPPNPASARFHAKFGFAELGRQWVADGTKEVSLQAAQLQG